MDTYPAERFAAYTIKMTQQQARLVRMAAAARSTTIADFVVRSAEAAAMKEVESFAQRELPAKGQP
jgi:uncharacterized protein (DUF1778 family)